MTEQNWTTKETYRWLANDEAAHEVIMGAPEAQRCAVIMDIVTKWTASGFMGNFTPKDCNSIDWDSLAADFADPPEGPRHEHDCNACTFLGRSGEYDVYHHNEAACQYAYFLHDSTESILLDNSQASAVSQALKMVTEHTKEIGK